MSDPQGTPARPRRSYGSGSLTIRTTSTGQRSWFGQWRAPGPDGRPQKLGRRIGPVRSPGERDGLTKRQAEAELRRLIAEVQPSRAAERLTFDELADRYVQHLENVGRKATTLAAVRGHLDHWHRPFLRGKAADAVSSSDVEDLLALMRDGRRPGGLNREKPLAPKTIRNAVGTLNALYTWAARKRMVAANPVADVELPVVRPTGELRFLDAADVRGAAANVASGPYAAIDRALIVTAAQTGLRVGELVALRWADVDWTARQVRVRRSYDVRSGFGTPKTKRSIRNVPLPAEVAALLDGLSRAGDDDDALVFADPLEGGPLSKRTILLRFRASLRAAGLDDSHRFHDLRHTFGTTMAAAGVDMTRLQHLMGHESITTTQIYAGYRPAPEHELALVEAAFAAERPAPIAAESPSEWAT